MYIHIYICNLYMQTNEKQKDAHQTSFFSCEKEWKLLEDCEWESFIFCFIFLVMFELLQEKTFLYYMCNFLLTHII